MPSTTLDFITLQTNRGWAIGFTLFGKTYVSGYAYYATEEEAHAAVPAFREGAARALLELPGVDLIDLPDDPQKPDAPASRDYDPKGN